MMIIRLPHLSSAATASIDEYTCAGCLVQDRDHGDSDVVREVNEM